MGKQGSEASGNPWLEVSSVTVSASAAGWTGSALLVALDGMRACVHPSVYAQYLWTFNIPCIAVTEAGGAHQVGLPEVCPPWRASLTMARVSTGGTGSHVVVAEVLDSEQCWSPRLPQHTSRHHSEHASVWQALAHMLSVYPSCALLQVGPELLWGALSA